MAYLHNQRYEVLDVLRSGGFGEIFFVTDRKDDNKKVIKKILSKENHEADILKQLNHPNITNLIKIFADKFFTYLVFEYYQNGDLENRIKSNKTSRISLSELVVTKWILNLASALNYLHYFKKIIHRDIKSMNILIKLKKNNSEEELILGDFGLATRISNLRYSITGTVLYMSPEMFNKYSNNDQDQKYDEKTDIWSLGIVGYELCKYELPFKTYDELKKFNDNPPRIENYSLNIESLIHKMLKKNPSERISAVDIENNLNRQMLSKS